MKLYIFRKSRISPSQKYLVFHGYFKGIHVAVPWISLIFPRFPTMLVPGRPFSQIWNLSLDMHYHYQSIVIVFLSIIGWWALNLKAFVTDAVVWLSIIYWALLSHRVGLNPTDSTTE